MKCFTEDEIRLMITNAWGLGFFQGALDHIQASEPMVPQPSEFAQSEFKNYLDVTMRNIG